MDHITQPEKASNHDNMTSLEAQIRECYGRVAYSHKAHEKCADIYHARLRLLKITQILLSSIVTGGLFVTIIGKNETSTIVSAITSAILLALNAYTKDYDLGQLSQKHSSIAGQLWNIRESYLSLISDIRGGLLDAGSAIKKRESLQEALNNVYQSAPRTISKAYKEAQKALQVNEELTFSDDEIDNLLPTHLRKTRF